MTIKSEIQRIYDEHANGLFAFLLNFTRNEDDTRDLVQDIFVRLARQPELVQRARHERAFLLRLAHNAAVDLMRRRVAREKYHELFGDERATVFASATDQDEQAFRDAVSVALGELPPEQRAVVHLKLWEELTFEQIAVVSGVPPNTAASRYRYALDKLRERLRLFYEEVK